MAASSAFPRETSADQVNRAIGAALCARDADARGEQLARNVAPRRFDFSLLRHPRFDKLSCMYGNAHRIPQPGGTGNVGAPRTLEAVQRASPVGPIGHHSMAASVRIVDSLVRRSTVRISPPVSMGLRTIETGGANLAQRQNLRAFARVSLDAKVHKTVSTALDSISF